MAGNKAKKSAEEESNLPLTKEELEDLFDWASAKLALMECDHSLLQTRLFMKERGLSEEKIGAWLAEYGGYCDCEVIANVEERWGSSVGSL